MRTEKEAHSPLWCHGEIFSIFKKENGMMVMVTVTVMVTVMGWDGGGGSGGGT